jgi:exosortase/archaeosortase family protein
MGRCIPCVCELGLRASISLLLVTVAAIVAANILRVGSLFFLETDIVTAPAFTHDATGVASFMLAAGIIMFFAVRLLRLRQ